MLTQVVLQTSSPMTLKVTDVSPDDIVIIENITGLSAPDVTLFTGDFSRDGGYYQGRRVNKRNPVFKLKINPDYKNDIAVSDVRELLYKQFWEPQPLSDAVQMLFKDDRKPDRYLIGFCESNASELFVKDPEAEVSLICVDPMFRSATAVAVTSAGFVSTAVNYDGSADTGMTLTVKVNTATTVINISIGGQTMTLNGTFAVNDLVTINTSIGSRFIRKNGVDYMSSLTAASKWLMLNQPAMTLAVDGGAAGDGKAVVTAYGYRSAWWGI